MRALGLTGGIGMGKSTSALILQRRGIPVVDSDAIAREIVEPGRPALDEIRREFGDAVIDGTGCLRRKELGRIVFADEAARKKLESILHPRIRVIWKAQLQAWRDAGHATAVAMIPLLFETDSAAVFDATICVACSESTQRRRLHERGWSDQEIDLRNQAQMPIEKKLALSDFVVWTEGTLAAHEAQLHRIIT